MAFLDKDTIAASGPRPWLEAPLKAAREVMQRHGLWHINQQMGSRWPIACVALEVTQRCNLDCTLCYLSEHSQAIRDLPLEEVMRRIDEIHRYYGPGTDVQITGGDPTLRDADELETIVARIASLGMRSTLMTNGIRASRVLLQRLAAAGLMDVAFHVDTTQELKGYDSEVALNEVREKYLARVRDLPLSVMFNTTLHQGNYHEVPALVAFFGRHAARLRTVSFQLQAETGRGTLAQRTDAITLDNTLARIEQGLGVRLNFDAVQAGHPQCNRYGMALFVDGQAEDFYDDGELFGRLLRRSRAVRWDRNHPWRSAGGFIRWLGGQPRLATSLVKWGAGRLWQHRAALWRSRGKVTTLSFFVHNFMDACQLDPARIDCCVFNTMTRDGPISMCLHNAKRDAMIHQPVQLADGRIWSPTTGIDTTDTPGLVQTVEVVPIEQLPKRFLKGRSRQAWLAEKAARRSGVRLGEP